MHSVYRLTIITVVFNGREAFARTLQSISKQKTAEVEYVVIDGGSTDGTLALANAYANIIDNLISEPDSGIFDAMNKGLRISRGDAIMFLNAGDTLRPDAITILLAAARSAHDVVCHAITCCEGAREIRVYQPQPPPANFDPQHMYWPHPGIVAKQSTFASIGLFDQSLRDSADLDWTNRVIKTSSLKVGYSNCSVVNFELGGNSSSPRAARETREVAISHGKSVLMAYLRYTKVRIHQLAAQSISKITSLGNGQLQGRR